MGNKVLVGSIVLLCAAAPAAWAELSDWRIDPAHSAAQFSVRHMMVSNVRGHFKVSGTAKWDPQNPAASSIDAAIDVASLNTREVKRDAHLKSPDFFDAEKFPNMTFKSKKVERAGEGKLKMTGDLTIHGVTKEVVFDVEGPTQELKSPQGTRIGAGATARINRKDFGLAWNRAIEGGGVVVGDEVQITMDVEMVKSQQRK